MVPEIRHTAVRKPMKHMTLMTISASFIPAVPKPTSAGNEKLRCFPTQRNAASPASSGKIIEYPVKSVSIMPARNKANAMIRSILQHRLLLHLRIQLPFQFREALQKCLLHLLHRHEIPRRL